jgi:hypothetical protein
MIRPSRSRLRRLRAPLLVSLVLLAGMVLDAVTGAWPAVAALLVLTPAMVLAVYWLGTTDTDVGALARSCPDERQLSMRQRARGTASVAMLGAALAGAALTAAWGADAAPYTLVAAAGVTAFCVGLPVAAVVRGAGLGDLRAAFGPRADERQRAVRSWALQAAGVVMVLVASVGGVARRGQGSAWYFESLIGVFLVAALSEFGRQRPTSRGGFWPIRRSSNDRM